jgi:hypothetical protein
MTWLKTAITRNFYLKALSLALALGIWIAVGGDVSTEILLPVPVEFRNVPKGIHYTAQPNRVELRVRGPRWMLRQASAADFSVPVDLSGVGGAGEKLIPLSPQIASAPSSVEVVDINPHELRLSVITAGAR